MELESFCPMKTSNEASNFDKFISTSTETSQIWTFQYKTFELFIYIVIIFVNNILL